MTNWETHREDFERMGLNPDYKAKITKRVGIKKDGALMLCGPGTCFDCIFFAARGDCEQLTDKWLDEEAEPKKKPHNPQADKKAKKEKIEVGDTVKVTTKSRGKYREIGVVRRIRSTSKGKKIYGVHFGGDKSGYAFSEHEIEKVKAKKKPRIVVYQDGNKVIAKDLVSGKHGEAICSPKDTFDFGYGAYLAVARMTVESARAEIALSRLNDAMESLEEARAYLETMK